MHHVRIVSRRPAPCTVLGLAALLAIVAWWTPAGAHQVNTSYSLLSLGSGQARMVVSLDEADLRLVEPGLDTNGDQVLWPDEVAPGAERLQAWVGERLSLRIDGEPLTPVPAATRVDTDADGNLFLRIGFSLEVPADPRRLQVDLSQLLQPPLLPGHKNLLRVMVPGRQESLSVLSGQQPTHEMALADQPEPSLLAQVGRFVWLGMEHIWIGYDHIMFLLALIVVGSRVGPLVRIVTAFTVAHSITLVLAALQWVSLPSWIVESGIALSIAYVAAENFWLRNAGHRWILTFAFGLVHGFGFANVLRDLGLPSRGLVASLLAFNVGVEIGQVAIVAVMFPAILWLSRQSYHVRAVRTVSGFVLLFGLGWLVERLFDLSYMPF